MIITTKLTEKQLAQVHNLIIACSTKQDMFDHLISIGVNAFNALLMSNSFERQTASFTLRPIIEAGIEPRQYDWNDYYKCMEWTNWDQKGA